MVSPPRALPPSLFLTLQPFRFVIHAQFVVLLTVMEVPLPPPSLQSCVFAALPPPSSTVSLSGLCSSVRLAVSGDPVFS